MGRWQEMEMSSSPLFLVRGSETVIINWKKEINYKEKSFPPETVRQWHRLLRDDVHLHLRRFSKLGGINSQATCCSPMTDPALSRRLDHRSSEVFSHMNYPVILITNSSLQLQDFFLHIYSSCWLGVADETCSSQSVFWKWTKTSDMCVDSGLQKTAWSGTQEVYNHPKNEILQ